MCGEIFIELPLLNNLTSVSNVKGIFMTLIFPTSHFHFPPTSKLEIVVSIVDG